MSVTRRSLVRIVVGVALVGAHDGGAAELLDLNTATEGQLAALPGLGKERAQMIVRVREKNGPFKAVEELLTLPRLTRRQFEQLRGLLYVGEQRDARKPDATQPDPHDTPEG